MNVLERYLTVVPLPVLIMALAGVIAIVVFTPPRLRLPLGILALPIWLTLSQATELRYINAVATATTGLLYLYVALAALLDTGPKRSIPFILWLYPLLGLYSLLLCVTTEDAVTALVIQLHWILLTIMAIVVARTIVDATSLHRIVHPLAVGVAIALLIPLADVILSGTAIFRRVGRFFPWGANPNQMGLLFSMAIPLGLYFAIQARSIVPRVFWSAVVAAAVSMALLTASRSVIIVALIPLVPLLIALTKRPVVAIVVLVVAGGAAMFLMGDLAGRYHRFTTLETGRWAIVQEYLSVTAQRPLTGLMGTTGEHFLRDTTIGKQMHNAYVWLLYVGGIPYLLAYLALAAVTGYCAFRIWRARASLPVDPVLISVLFFSLIAVYAHGLVNMSIYYATYLWAFWHLLLSAFCIMWLAEARQAASVDQVDYELEDDQMLESEYSGEYGSQHDPHGAPAY